MMQCSIAMPGELRLVGQRQSRFRPFHRDHGVIYYALANGSKIVEVAFPCLTPNGIGLSPDGKVLYVAETEPARLWAFDITAPGVVNKQGWPSPNGGRLVTGLGGFQRFDSQIGRAHV